MAKKYYIAYGSNLNTQQMFYRCPTAEVVGTGYITGYELLFKGSKTGAYLTIEPHPLGRVPVAVWSVEPADERALDRYEGFPTFYYKRNFDLTIKTLKGRKKNLTGFAYIMHEDRPTGNPTKSYVNVCLAGYKEFDFNPNFLTYAIERSNEI